MFYQRVETGVYQHTMHITSALQLKAQDVVNNVHNI